MHHDPKRALGDLTGIKKHFCRKHGEKKWKCERCAKKYAVQSDWKAHMKTCGTKEYRCDCGTLFSRYVVCVFLVAQKMQENQTLSFSRKSKNTNWVLNRPMHVGLRVSNCSERRSVRNRISSVAMIC